MHPVLRDGVVREVDGFEFVMFENGDEFHDGIDPKTHGVEIEDKWKFFGVDLVERLFEDLGFLVVGFLTCVLAFGEEELYG
jgi:hypothetical protein